MHTASKMNTSHIPAGHYPIAVKMLDEANGISISSPTQEVRHSGGYNVQDQSAEA
jgi:hypothetical protein